MSFTFLCQLIHGCSKFSYAEKAYAYNKDFYSDFKTIAADVFVDNVNHTSSLVKSKSICTVKKCEGVSIRKHSILQDHLMSKSFSITETTRF